MVGLCGPKLDWLMYSDGNLTYHDTFSNRIYILRKAKDLWLLCGRYKWDYFTQQMGGFVLDRSAAGFMDIQVS